MALEGALFLDLLHRALNLFHQAPFTTAMTKRATRPVTWRRPSKSGTGRARAGGTNAILFSFSAPCFVDRLGFCITGPTRVTCFRNAATHPDVGNPDRETSR